MNDFNPTHVIAYTPPSGGKTEEWQVEMSHSKPTGRWICTAPGNGMHTFGSDSPTEPELQDWVQYAPGMDGKRRGKVAIRKL